MSANDLSDDELIEMLRVLRDHQGNKTAAAKSLGLARSTFTDRVDAAEGRGLRADTDLKRTKDAEIKKLKRKLAEATKDEDTAEKIRQKIYGIAAIDPSPPDWLVNTEKASSSGVPVVFWSDWHFGEVVRKDEVGGVNEYDSDIAKERARRLVENTIDLCMNHMTAPNYPGIVVALGGDMISGDIHEELQDTNDNYTFVTLNDLMDTLIPAITTLADTFNQVFIPCVVGNHGRSSKRPRMKGRVHTSYEWNLYVSLARWFQNDDRVHFLIPSETDAHFSVYGHRFLLTHGDSLGVRGGDGIIGAIGPIMRGSIKVGRLESQIGRDFDTIMMGHWHQYIPLPGIIVNNCLKGYDEFARLALRAPYSPPSQALFFVHPTYGITAHWQVFVEKEQHTAHERRDEPWIQLWGNLA